MTLKRVSAEQARQLLQQEGYTYLDVRSVPEFEQGHPEGAYNIPLLDMGAGGMQPNPDFLRVVEATFPKDSKLVVGCKSGGRSKRAATQLLEAGYNDVVDQRAGYAGASDAFGQVVEPGWQSAGLPCASDPEPGHSYRELKDKAQ